MARREGWTDLFRALGEAVLGVLQAEVAVLGEDWKETGKRVGVAAALGAVAFAFLVGVVLVGLYASVHLLQALSEWPLWKAGFVITLAGVALICTLLATAWFGFLRKLENPITAAQRRLGDHVAWWQQQFTDEDRQLSEGDFDEQEDSGS